MTAPSPTPPRDAAAIRTFDRADATAVVDLWTACGLVSPHNDPHRDIERKLQVGPDLFLVAAEDGRIVGSVMGGYEGHRGWANYLAVAPSHQRRGIATRLMQTLHTRLVARGCPKINLQIRASNASVVAFYESLGYVDDRVISMGRRLIDDVVEPVQKS